MTRLAAALAVVWLAACAPASPPLVDCTCTVLHRASDVSGAFVVHVDELITLSGPTIVAPSPTSLSATLVLEQNAIVATIGDATWAQRVSAYVALQAAPPGNCCSATYAVAPVQPADWHDADGVRLDASTEIGGAIGAFDPTLQRIEPVPSTVYDVPFSVDATGMTVPVEYLVAGPGCADETCASRIHVTYRFDRLGT